MPEDVKLLSSRRAYEFGMDELRLTMLSTAQVQQHIKQLFQFQLAAVGQPQPTFGPVPLTMPPGLAFDVGVWVSPDAEGMIIPIRLLHIEPRRIVIDISGPSSAIDQIYAALTTSLAAVTAPDGHPIIGSPERTRDYSEITARFSFTLDSVVAPGLRNVFARVVGADSGRALVPFFAMRAQSPDEEYPGVGLPNAEAAQLELRAGTRPDEHIFFSSAPLDSEAHLCYLAEIEAALAR